MIIEKYANIVPATVINGKKLLRLIKFLKSNICTKAFIASFVSENKTIPKKIIIPL